MTLWSSPCAGSPDLAELDSDLDVGVSYSVLEIRQGQQVLRELKLDLTHPGQFDLAVDV